MTEIIIYSTAYERHEREILRSACEWVRKISSHPNQWASEEDFNLIRSVRAAYPHLRCQWTENPEYEGWRDSTDPLTGGRR